MSPRAAGPGRPTSSEKEEKRAHLIRIIRKEIVRNDGEFSLNQALKAAGGSKTTLYSYFGGREGLLEAILDDVVQRNFVGSLNLDGPVSKVLDGFADATYKTVLSKEAIAVYRMAIAESHHSPSIARKFYETGPAIARKVLAGYLEQATGEGKLGITNYSLAADNFFGMLLDAPLLHRTLSLPAANDNLAARKREAIQVFLRAYSK